MKSKKNLFQLMQIILVQAARKNSSLMIITKLVESLLLAQLAVIIRSMELASSRSITFQSWVELNALVAVSI